MTRLQLRPAREDDMMLYFAWVNDPIVRKNAFQSEPVNLATHRTWFAQALSRNDVSMYVLEADDVPVGQVRLTWQGTTALIAYSVAAEHRAHGYGKALLELVEKKVSVGTCLLGQVKKENVASRRVFVSLGYEESYFRDMDCWEYRKKI
ncbi:GNAT family N-acetyltransferase [Selenomonas sp.]|uniref:GNAT family N-acetyltransferase n=1 Tax=Selenomonas sp. TaxID=2053611 RepID=UPI002A74B0D4|nr:GNAT family N-acetyltransferase [Selenomonas sp.]MDY3298072.1 GNAT family N-acetyltransferase [Selenomonas sp.]